MDSEKFLYHRKSRAPLYNSLEENHSTDTQHHKNQRPSPAYLKWPLYLILVASLIIAGYVCLDRQWTSRSLPVGAVTADNVVCSNVGKQMLLRGGSAVDAAIATLLCTSVRTPHSMGLGGGCFFVIYDKKSGKSVTINGRERAPLHVKEGYASAWKSLRNGAFINTPGEIKAYKLAHDMYGRLPWRELFQPAIEMTKGHPLSTATYGALMYADRERQRFNRRYPNETLFDKEPLVKFFSHDSWETLKEGAIVKMPNLGKTLTALSLYGPDYIYNSPVTDILIEELKEWGCKLTRDDFVQYTPTVTESTDFQLANMTMYTSDFFSAGPVLGLTLNVFQELNFTSEDIMDHKKTADAYHVMTEVFKFVQVQKDLASDPELYYDFTKQLIEKWKTKAFAANIRDRIDPKKTHESESYTDGNDVIIEQASDDTTHVAVLSPDGDAVSVTTSIDLYFGSIKISKETGIIFNSHGTEFNLLSRHNKNDMKMAPKNNFRPGKRARSNMAPAIFVDDAGNVRIVIGAAGGIRIANTLAQVLARILWMSETVDSAIAATRIHHHLQPNEIEHERTVPKEVLTRLNQTYGHALKQNPRFIGVVQSIRVHEDGRMEAVSDRRKPPGEGVFIYPSELLRKCSSCSNNNIG